MVTSLDPQAGIDDPAKVSIISITAKPIDPLVPDAEPAILVDFRLDVTDEVSCGFAALLL